MWIEGKEMVLTRKKKENHVRSIMEREELRNVLSYHFIDVLSSIIVDYLEKEQLFWCSRSLSKEQNHYDANGNLKFILIDSEYKQDKKVLDKICVVDGIMWRTTFEKFDKNSLLFLYVESYDKIKQSWNLQSKKHIFNKNLRGFQTLFVSERQELWTIEGFPLKKHDKNSKLQLSTFKLKSKSFWTTENFFVQTNKLYTKTMIEGDCLKPCSFVVSDFWVFVLTVAVEVVLGEPRSLGFLLHQIQILNQNSNIRTACIPFPFYVPESMSMCRSSFEPHLIRFLKKECHSLYFYTLDLNKLKWETPYYLLTGESLHFNYSYKDSKMKEVTLLYFKDHQPEHSFLVVQHQETPTPGFRKSRYPNLCLSINDYAYLATFPDIKYLKRKNPPPSRPYENMKQKTE
jgi:hypothetical protein